MLLKKIENEVFLLLDLKNNEKDVDIYTRIISKFHQRLSRISHVCWGTQHRHAHTIMNTMLYVCFVFVNTVPVFYMAFDTNSEGRVLYNPQQPELMIFNVCKDLTYRGKHVFKKAFQFCLNEPVIHRSIDAIYLGLEFKNPHICSAFCSYIRSGFIPFQIQSTNQQMIMKYKYKSNTV